MRILATLLFAFGVNLALLAQAPPIMLHTPADALAAALASVKSDPVSSSHVRFLWLGNSPNAQQRTDLISVVSFAVNSLSRRRLIVAPIPVGENLLRIDLRSYGLDPEAWDELGAKGSGPIRSVKKIDCPEPFFHLHQRTVFQEITEQLVDTAWFQQNGRWYNQRWEKVPGRKQVKEQLVHGPWLPAEQVAALVLATQSDFPILEARWFVANSLITPAYNRFLGLQNEQDFDNLVRFRKRDEDLSVRGIALFSSQVALHNRSLVRGPTVFGTRWRSNDYGTSLGEQDLLADPLDKDKAADAHEYIANLPNGLHAFLITNKQLNAIDFGDTQIVADKQRMTGWEQTAIWPAISCLLCHQQGINPFEDSVRRLADAGRNISAVVRQQDLERFADAFGPNHKDFITTDQTRYAQAVQICTGKPVANATGALSKVFLGHVQEPITLDVAAGETGYEKTRILVTLKNARQLDHSLVQLLSGQNVRRDQWEATGYAQLMLLMLRNSNP